LELRIYRLLYLLVISEKFAFLTEITNIYIL
jgi:hypothetical protein